MINYTSIDALKKAKWTPRFKKPLYQSYSFACIPDTVSKLLTGKGKNPLSVDTVCGRWEKYDCVVLFVIDAFGWSFYEDFADKHPLLKRFEKEGAASKISAQFPSTTAAHITTLNTGMQVGETGIYEWFYYEPLADRMIAPLLFSTAGDHQSGTLIDEGFSPKKIFPFETVYQKLSKQGVESIIMQPAAIAFSDYSQTLTSGAKVEPFELLPQALDKLVDICRKPVKKPRYIVVYWGDIDSMGHRHGVDSPQFADAIDHCWTSIEEHFVQKMSHSPNKTAILFTADHGMTAVDPKTTVYLNGVCPKIETMIKKSKAGYPLIPAGSCRDFFLHIEPCFVEEAKAMLDKELKGKADVLHTNELIKEGFFGTKPVSNRLKERIGDLVVLPYRTESVFWWFAKHKFEQHFYGSHGGLTPEEMESILLFLSLGKS